MKEYPLEIHEMLEGGFYSKGHHDIQLFVEAIKRDYEVDITSRLVYHDWVRSRPALPHEREEYGKATFFEDAKKGERGAYPVTMYF